MFCTNCGKEIMDGAKFCVHCGTPVDEAAWPDGQGAAQQAYVQPEQPYVPQQAYAQPGYADDGQEERPSNTKRIKIIAASVVGALVLAGAGTGIFLMASGRGGEETEEEETRTHETKRREKEEVQETQAEDEETADEETADAHTLRQETLEAKEQELLAQDDGTGGSLASYAAYQDILNEFYDAVILLYESGWGADLPAAHFGSMDCIYYQYGFDTAEEALDSVGYTLQDFDGNGVDELVVGLPSGDILELYTLRNGEATPLLLNETYREAYWLAEDNVIYYQGSGGAAAGSIAAYRITGNGVELIEDYSWDFGYGTENSVTHKIGGILMTPGYGSVDGAATEVLTVDEETFYDEIMDSLFTSPDKTMTVTSLASLQSAPQDDGTQENGGGGFDFGRGASGTYKAGSWQAAAGAFMDDVLTIFQDALYADRETVRNDTVTLMKTMVQDTFSVVPEEMVNEALRESGYDSLDDMMAASLTDDAIGNVEDELFPGFDEDLRDQNLLEQGLTNVTVSYEILGAEDVTGYELDSIREIWAEMNVEVSAAKNANIVIRVTDNNSGETVVEDTQSLPLARIGGSWMVDLPAM